MNSNKNFVEVIGSIFLICLIVVFCGVISVKGICVDTIKEVFISDEVKNNDYQAPDLEGKFDNLTGDIVNKVVNETGEELSSQQKANLEKQIELREEEIQDLINKNVE